LSERSFRWGRLVLFLVALGARIAVVNQFESAHPQAQDPLIDEASYERWAGQIAGGDWLGDQIFFQEPLYPYWLGSVYALAGGDAAARRTCARVVQAGLGALTAVLVALLGRRLFGSGAGLVAGAAFALHRTALWMPALLLKPNLFLPLLVVLALALVRASGPRAWLGVGALAALGALLRGNVLILLPAFALWPLARARLERGDWKRALPCALAVVAGAALVLLPVAARNAVVGGRFLLTTSGAGTNVYGGNNPDNPYGIAKEFDWVRGIPQFEADDWRHEAERRLGRELDPAETSSYWLGQAARSMAERPLAHLGIFWRKLRLSLGGYEVPDNHFIDWDARHVPLLALPWPGFALLGGLGIAGALLYAAGGLRRSRPATEVLALTLLYLATIVLTVTSARIRLALVPLLLPFAGGLVAALPGLRGRARLAAAGSLLVAALLVLVPVLPAAKRAEDFDERDFNLAGGLIERGELSAADELLRPLERRHPQSARVARRRAEVDYLRARERLQAGGLDQRELLEVQDAVEDVLLRLRAITDGSNPRERFRAAALTGRILQEQGQWGAAAGSYREALAFDPEDRELRRRLALVVAEQAMTRDGEERSAGLREAERLLEELNAEAPDPAVASLLEQIRGQR